MTVLAVAVTLGLHLFNLFLDNFAITGLVIVHFVQITPFMFLKSIAPVIETFVFVVSAGVTLGIAIILLIGFPLPIVGLASGAF